MDNDSFTLLLEYHHYLVQLLYKNNLGIVVFTVFVAIVIARVYDALEIKHKYG